MTLRKILLLCFILSCPFLLAQNDSVNNLKEVVISDPQLKNFSNTQSVLKLNDSVIRKNQASLTSLLNYNSVIYFKENGLGMVSSASFRGTTAQQTAVLWNGININSQLNGLTDFNTIAARDYNSVSIKAGGGSSIYGSSAIGGSIHLNNDMVFKNQFKNELQFNYGSFNTIGTHYNLQASSNKFSTQLSISRNSSDNDYDYPGSTSKNLNGQYANLSLGATIGYQLNNTNFLKFYSQAFDGERHFSVLFQSETRTKYQDLNTRNLLEWDNFLGRFTSKLKFAALSEKYKYFQNINSDSYTFGKVETFIGKYDLAYDFNDKMKINAIIDYTQSKGNGSDIKNEKRNIGSASLLFKHQLLKKLLYELSVRQEITNNYKSPLLFSAGIDLHAISFYHLKINGSKNFRIPTFNDLYWQPGGNSDLRPESSYQAEVGNHFQFRNLKLVITGYYIDIKDMLRWLPNGNNWSPENTDKVTTYGGEALLNWHKNLGPHQLSFNGTYAYTISKNDDTNKQLIYVPYHKATAAIGYALKRFSANYQFLFNGEVYTRSDNNAKYNLDSYSVSNAMMEYDFGKSNPIKLGFQVLNLWNEKYQSVESRFMPGRNYSLSLMLCF